MVMMLRISLMAMKIMIMVNRYVYKNEDEDDVNSTMEKRMAAVSVTLHQKKIKSESFFDFFSRVE